MIAFMELQTLFESNMFVSEDEGVVIAFCISLLPNAAGSESELEHSWSWDCWGCLGQVFEDSWKKRLMVSTCNCYTPGGWQATLFHFVFFQTTQNHEIRKTYLFSWTLIDPYWNQKGIITSNHVLVLGLLFRKPVVEVFHGCQGAENVLPIGIQSIAAVKQVILNHRMPWMNNRLSMLRVNFSKTVLDPTVKIPINLILHVNSIDFLANKDKGARHNLFIETHQCSQNLI